MIKKSCCGFNFAENDRYCDRCGRLLSDKTFCDDCGTMIPENEAVCSRCGSRTRDGGHDTANERWIQNETK